MRTPPITGRGDEPLWQLGPLILGPFAAALPPPRYVVFAALADLTGLHLHVTDAARRRARQMYVTPAMIAQLATPGDAERYGAALAREFVTSRAQPAAKKNREGGGGGITRKPEIGTG